MIKTFISGNLTADPVLSDIGCCNFTVAANSAVIVDGKPKTEFVRCAVWGKSGEAAAKHLKKGDPVSVCGDYASSSYVDRNGEKQFSINLRNASFDFIRANSSQQGAAAHAQADDDEDDVDIFNS